MENLKKIGKFVSLILLVAGFIIIISCLQEHKAKRIPVISTAIERQIDTGALFYTESEEAVMAGRMLLKMRNL